jgi:hypothetical protein
MTDSSTQDRLRVSTDSTAGPYLMVPFSQLNDVEQLLTRHDTHYWVEENVISLNGAPEIATINFGRGADARAVQKILDSVH